MFCATNERKKNISYIRRIIMSVCFFQKILIWIFSIVAVTDGYLSCSKDVAWEKVRNVKPESARELHVLYRGIDSQGIVSACFEKCKSLKCNAFIINLEKSYCYSVEWKGDEFIPEPNVTFYHKICLKVPKTCLDRYWQVERNLGSVLLDSMAVKTIPEIISRTECYEACFNAEKNCKAAEFQSSRDLFINDTSGICTLLTFEKEMKPQAYRASLYRDEYLENQCHNITKTDFCSYAEYRNMLMPYSDLKLIGLSVKECEKKCDENSDGFLCRAFGIEKTNSNFSTCYLYSEDTIGSGASVLVISPNSFYREREPCINMNIHCTSSSLTIQLHTNDPFNGRIYANGFSDSCGVQGHGGNLTTLVLPLPTFGDARNSSDCGLTWHYSPIGENRETRAFIWSTVIVQFNPIIQRLGDQAVRVGCSFTNGTIPTPQNISVNSGFTFINPNAGLPPIVTKVVNTSSLAPIISMKILDENLKPANVTHLGQKLILKIQMSPSQGPFDMTAGNLVASSYSGDSSLLLLDEQGCPATPIFPALAKDSADNRSLVAEFNAFKFPNSQHVTFNVIVKFCLEICKPAICKNNSEAVYGRKKRLARNENVDEKEDLIDNVQRSSNGTTEELPLQTTIIVQYNQSSRQNIVPNPLKESHGADTFIVVDSDRMDSHFCMDTNLILFSLVTLLIVQIVLIGSCIFSIRSYRRLAVKAEEDRADILTRHLYGIHGGNFEISRRVRWIDNNSSTLSY